MRYLAGYVVAATLFAGPALAADMAVKAPAAPAAPTCIWCGFYIGIHGGEAEASDRIVDVDRLNGGAHYTLHASGAIGGGQIGFQWQTAWLVYGIEGDFGGMDLRGKMFDPNFPGGTFSLLKSGAYGDVTGRLGWAIGNGNALAYVKGGWATYDGKAAINNTLGGFAGGEAQSPHYSSGWTFGGGLELMVLPAWSMKVEYQHFDFGTRTATLITPLNGNFRYTNALTVDAVMGGINYHFPANLLWH